MCKSYGYIRVSTGTQAEKGYGLEAQRDEIKRYCDAQGITLAAIFEDAGISGNIKDTDDDDAINKRKGLIEMLATLEAGDVVIVLNTSRLWRSDMTKAIVRREIMRKAAKVTSIEQPKYDLYSKDPGDYLINAIMEALDVYERMSITLKLARGRATKAHKGDKPAGAVPYGYRYTPDKKAVEINPDEAPTVKRMFSQAQTGKSLAQIKADLDAQGITTRRGNPFSRGSVAAMLSNRFYVGELSHAGEPIKGNHPALISKVQFGKVQAQLAKHSKHQKPTEKPQEATTAPAKATPDHSAQPMQEAAQSAPQAAQLATIKAEIEKLTAQRDEARKAGDEATARWYSERAEALKDEAREIEWANH